MQCSSGASVLVVLMVLVLVVVLALLVVLMVLLVLVVPMVLMGHSSRAVLHVNGSQKSSIAFG